MSAFQKVGEIKIYGDTWEFGWGYCGKTANGPAIGKCYYHLKRIAINKQYHKHCPLSDVLAHEILHAYLPIAKEKFVEEFGFNVGEAQKQMEYNVSP
jgi:hypothetical protein